MTFDWIDWAAYTICIGIFVGGLGSIAYLIACKG